MEGISKFLNSPVSFDLKITKFEALASAGFLIALFLIAVALYRRGFSRSIENS